MTCKSEKLSNIRWKDINWKQAETYVKRLQIRIVKAVKQNKWNLVKRLQYLLTNSFYAKLIAIKKVTSNKGKNTAGIDGEIWKSQEEKIKSISKINNKNYKAQPTKRIHIPKRNGKLRPLSIPTMKDRTMQTLQLLALQPIQETIGDKNSYGFRINRSCQDAMARIFLYLSRKNSPQWILEGDIKGCFENISHKWILQNIPMDKQILKQFIKAGYIYKNEMFPNNKGAAQGGAISPTIANFVLDKMEETIYKKLNIGKKGKPIQKNLHKLRFVRYADDFIVAGENIETLERVKTIIKEFLKERGLELADEKTVITNIEEGFDFLGWNFRKYNKKLIIKPNKKSIQGIKKKISDMIKENIASKQEDLIKQLNPIILGWSTYNQNVCSKKIFQKLDDFTFKQLYNWALKRHRNKGKRWVINKYWHKEKSRNWIFKENNNALRLFSDTPIIRHYWINTSKNPYTDEKYFENLKLKQKAKKYYRIKETVAFDFMQSNKLNVLEA